MPEEILAQTQQFCQGLSPTPCQKGLGKPAGWRHLLEAAQSSGERRRISGWGWRLVGGQFTRPLWKNLVYPMKNPWAKYDINQNTPVLGNEQQRGLEIYRVIGQSCLILLLCYVLFHLFEIPVWSPPGLFLPSNPSQSGDFCVQSCVKQN